MGGYFLKHLSGLLFLLVITNSAEANLFDDLFAVVFIDNQTEKLYGSIPLQRKVVAKAINQLAEAGAKGIVLKFFLDRARDVQGDQLLAKALTELPVVLQARFDDSEIDPNHFPSRFRFPGNVKTQLAGHSGWVPLPLFANLAADIGFVDFSGFPVSLFVTYQQSSVKSLLLSSIEMAVDQKLRLQPGKTVELGDRVYPVDRFNRINVNLKSGMDETYIPLHEILDGKHLSKVKGKVIILGYYGPKIHAIPTNLGAVSAHLLFVKILQSLLSRDN